MVSFQLAHRFKECGTKVVGSHADPKYNLGTDSGRAPRRIQDHQVKHTLANAGFLAVFPLALPFGCLAGGRVGELCLSGRSGLSGHFLRG